MHPYNFKAYNLNIEGFVPLRLFKVVSFLVVLTYTVLF